MKFHEKRLLNFPFKLVSNLSKKKCDAVMTIFLLAETEVVMTTLTSSHVKEKLYLHWIRNFGHWKHLVILSVSNNNKSYRYRVEHSKTNSISPRAQCIIFLFIFSKGSIVTEFKLIFNAKDESEAFEMLKEKIKHGNLGALRVDPSSLVRIASTTKGDFKPPFLLFKSVYIVIGLSVYPCIYYEANFKMHKLKILEVDLSYVRKLINLWTYRRRTCLG